MRQIFHPAVGWMNDVEFQLMKQRCSGWSVTEWTPDKLAAIRASSTQVSGLSQSFHERRERSDNLLV